jgi:hypothetical protein
MCKIPLRAHHISIHINTCVRYIFFLLVHMSGIFSININTCVMNIFPLQYYQGSITLSSP